MASVSGMTVEELESRLNQMVVSVRVDGEGKIIFRRRNGNEIDAGTMYPPVEAARRSWPVGSVFITTVPTNPAELLGMGTWVRYGAGKVFVGQDPAQPEFDVVDKVGGNKKVTLTRANVPAHTHTTPAHSHSYTLTYNTSEFSNGNGGDRSRVTAVNVGTGGSEDRSGNTGAGGGGTSGSAGSGEAFDNMPPYITVYTWRRTA